MRFGIRRPSFRKSIVARLSWKRAVRNSLGLKAPRGWGWITNPKKASYNWVYNRTTISWKKPEALVFLAFAAFFVVGFEAIKGLFKFILWLFTKPWKKTEPPKQQAAPEEKMEFEEEPVEPLHTKVTQRDPKPRKNKTRIIPNWTLPKSTVFGETTVDTWAKVLLTGFIDDKALGSRLSIPLGKDEEGIFVFLDLDQVGHLLMAGTTGSGKSVFLDSVISTLIFRNTPQEVRLVLLDSSRVDFGVYRDLPHLAISVTNDPKEFALSLLWVLREMRDRQETLQKAGLRDIYSFNKKYKDEPQVIPIYSIVVVLNDMGTLMSDQIHDLITPIAREGHKYGIHLVISTPRPSVNVITGEIKASIPARIAFKVPAKADSIVILNQSGAESLSGKGEMLYLSPLSSGLKKIQGPYVSLDLVEKLVNFWNSQGGPDYLTNTTRDEVIEESEDELYDEAVEIVRQTQQASTSLLQRRLKVGYSRAAKLLDDMEIRGLVGPAEGNKPREILN